jgi:cytochrome c-type biogenesis protein CcmE
METTMSPFRTKTLTAGAILTFAVGYLAFAGVRAGRVYYLNVTTFLADGGYHGQRVRLHGAVGTQDFQVNPGQGDARFLLLDGAATLPVTYKGVVPDLFRPGCEVVVEGILGQDHVFQAEKLLTKCASKYDRRGPTSGGAS